MFTLKQLSEIFPYFIGDVQEEVTVLEVMTDSRKKVANALFIPIIGDQFDGHTFIDGAIHNGAIATLWDESIPLPKNKESSIVFFMVKDTVSALQQLAKKYRERVNPTVIGITGSNGKTSTKDLLKTVLQEKYITYATVGNFNNHIGLPLTILQMDEETEMLILEMGMSNFGEIELLSKIGLPDYAIITNIGESHIEHLGSREGIAKAKLEIKAGLNKDGVLIIDGDELLLKTEHDNDVLTCGFTPSNDFIVKNVQMTELATSFVVNGEAYTIPLVGKHHAQNASFIIALASHFQMDQQIIQPGFDRLQYSKMRFERIIGKNGVTLINDAYNASPTSMKAAIEVVKDLPNYEIKIVVLGDILELGDYMESMHRSIASVIDEQLNFVLLYGDAMQFLYDELQQYPNETVVEYFTSREALEEKLTQYAQEETVMLFKASRGMAFEQFVAKLEA